MKHILFPLLMAVAVGSACAAPANTPATVTQLSAMSARYAPVELTADIAHLSAGDRQASAKLVEAASAGPAMRRCGRR